MCSVACVVCSVQSFLCVQCAVFLEFAIAMCCWMRRGVASVPRGGTKTPHLLMLLRMKTMMMMFVMARMMMMVMFLMERMMMMTAIKMEV